MPIFNIGIVPDSIYVEIYCGSLEGTTPGCNMYIDDFSVVYGPSAVVTPNLWNAGNVNLGSSVTSVPFILRNDGQGTLTVSAISSLPSG